MQRQMNVDQPDYGHLFDRTFWPEAEPIPLPFFLQPRVEPETAFVLAKPLRGPGVTVAEAIAAVGFVLPALERAQFCHSRALRCCAWPRRHACWRH